MIYEGKITHIGQEELVGKNELPKRTIVLEEISDNEWKGGVAFDLFKERTSLIDGYKQGESIRAHLNVRVNEYNGRYYNSVSAWKIERLDAAAAGGQSYDEDLPF